MLVRIVITRGTCVFYFKITEFAINMANMQTLFLQFRKEKQLKKNWKKVTFIKNSYDFFFNRTSFDAKL